MATATKSKKTKMRTTTSEELLALEELPKEIYENENVLDYTQYCMVQYGKQTLENRAVPDYRDGLIPVQRRILYAMFKHRVGFSDDMVKAAKVVGTVLGNYHPHGDNSCYEAMVTLVQAPIKFIQGSGNWGSYDSPDSAAAYRYTQCRVSDLAKAVFFDGCLTKAHDLIANFDESDREPVVLHCNIPVALVLGKVSGIAVGLATNAPAFTLDSVAKLTRIALSGKKITLKMCRETLVFTAPWGNGTLQSKHYSDGSYESVLTNGTGNLSFLPDYVHDAKNHTVTIKGLPLNLKYETAVDDTHAAGYPFSDGTSVDSDGLDIVISLKKNRSHTPDKADLNKVLSIWTGRTFVTNIAVTDRKVTEAALSEGASKLDIEVIPEIGVIDLLNKWAEYRLALEVQMAKIEKQDLQEQIERLDLIILARQNIDTIHAAWGVDNPIQYVADELEITLEQSKYIFSLTIMRLTKIDIAETKNKIKALKGSIKECNERIKNPAPSAIACVDNIVEKFGA